MSRRVQVFLVLLSVALQLADGSLAVIGHEHGDARSPQGNATAAESRSHHAHSGCHHHHHAGCATEQSSSQPSDSQHRHVPHDDCSLCRHFSQSATAVTLPVVLPPSEVVATVVVPAIPRVETRLVSRQRSRAPPLNVA